MIMERLDIRDLLPRHKTDVERARALVALGFPAVEPVVGDLFLWLRDFNWPVAREIAPFLSSLAPSAVLPNVKAVLSSRDAIWKYWVLTLLVEHFPADSLRAIERELAQLATAPDTDDVAEGVDEIARDLLERLREAEPV